MLMSLLGVRNLQANRKVLDAEKGVNVIPDPM